MITNLKINRYIMLLSGLLVLTIFLTGCTTSSSIPSNQEGVITGTVELDSQTTISHIPQKEPDTNSGNVYFTTASNRNNEAEPGAYIIKFETQITSNTIVENILQGEKDLLKSPPKKIGDKTFTLKISEDASKRVKELLLSCSDIDYIEPDYTVKVQASPSDPYYSQQWNLEMMNLETTWKKFRGKSGIKVAVIDTGIRPEHPDLADNIGRGYDILEGDTDPTDSDTTFSHGTHVAGIIGAVTNNNQGVAGINWKIEIMPVRVIPSNGTGSVSHLIEGIRWAVDNGAQIINLSLASSGGSTSLREAVDYATANGVTVVAAAGNNGSYGISYPAQYSNVISVGAVGPTRERAYYSNFGPKLDLVAPGGDSSVTSASHNTILSTVGTNDYSLAQGTSMAAPHISGAAALLYSSGTTNPVQIREKLIETAEPLDESGMDSDYYGAGLVNINQALGLTTSNNYGGNNSSTPELTDIIIYTVEADNKGVSSQRTSPDRNGDYSLSTPTGRREIVAWLDKNEDGEINQGDYLARERIAIDSGQRREIDLKLSIVK